MAGTTHYTTLILSDIHLGKDVCQADMLLQFLTHHTCDTLILNGDILDGWAIQRRVGVPLPPRQCQVLDIINHIVASGARVIMTAGNHDDALRRPDIIGHTHLGIEMAETHVHTDAKGRRFVVMHGDQFDPPVLRDRRASILSHIGDAAYDLLIALNRLFNGTIGRVCGVQVHFSAYLKQKTKKLVRALGGFGHKVLEVAQAEKAQGVLCGHIHYAEWTRHRGILYGNSGDWIEGCTALAEDANGDWHILRWRDNGQHPDPAPYPATQVQLQKIRQLWPETPH